MLNNFKANFRCLSNFHRIFAAFFYLCSLIKNASLAQLVEQLTRNEQVVGSSPMGGSEKTRT